MSNFSIVYFRQEERTAEARLETGDLWKVIESTEIIINARAIRFELHSTVYFVTVLLEFRLSSISGGSVTDLQGKLGNSGFQKIIQLRVQVK